jgi:signal transduction histidine kinase
MISVQAETARLTTPGMPAEGAAQLATIGDTARAALAEMRRLLSVLRDDAGTELTRRPQPGLTQLIELIDEARESAGTSTRLIGLRAGPSPGAWCRTDRLSHCAGSTHERAAARPERRGGR